MAASTQTALRYSLFPAKVDRPMKDSPLSRSGPPKPRGLPWIGCLNALLRDPMAFFAPIARRYGGIAHIPLKGGLSVYLVSEPSLIKELLVDNREAYQKNIRHGAMQRLIGDGLLLSEGETWRRERRATQPAFRLAEIDHQLGWMTAAIENFLDRWAPRAADAKLVDIEPLFSELTQYLAGRLLFGPRYDARAREILTLVEAIRANWPKPPRSVLASYLPRSKREAARLEAVAVLDAQLFEFIRLERAEPRPAESTLGQLIENSREIGAPFTDKELRDQLATLFFAGFETSAAAMTWTHYLLARNPDKRERVFVEVDEKFGAGIPMHAQLDALTYVDQVFKEALRVHLPIHAFSRVALDENTVGGYQLPRGCTVTVSAHATHRLPEHWPDPEAFVPERFAADANAARHAFAYIPFGAGPRQCVGAQFAMLLGKLILALVARRYVLDLASDTLVRIYSTTVSRPDGGMFMRICRRPADVRS